MIIYLADISICVMLGIILLILSIMSLFLYDRKLAYISITFIVISLLLIVIPISILLKSTYIYNRLDYGYFAHVNNLMRHTAAINKPLIVESFTNIHLKKNMNLPIVERSNNNQLIYENYKLLSIILPKQQDLNEHRMYPHYLSDDFPKKRKLLKKTFNKFYYIDKAILDKTNIFNDKFEKGAIGAHIRFAKHYINKTIEFSDQIKSYTDYIDKSNYEYVYLATHLKDIEDIFRNKYKDRLIIYDHYRNPDKNTDWVSNDIDQSQEDTNVLIDMILLSKCKEIVGGPSNVFYAALWYNPDIKFYIPDILKDVICG